MLGSSAAQEWRYYGGDAGGMRFSPLTQISRENVNHLARAWTYHTGEIDREGNATDRRRIAPFESTSLVIDGVLYFSTPSSGVIALDADTVQRFGDSILRQTAENPGSTINTGACRIGGVRMVKTKEFCMARLTGD